MTRLAHTSWTLSAQCHEKIEIRRRRGEEKTNEDEEEKNKKKNKD